MQMLFYENKNRKSLTAGSGVYENMNSKRLTTLLYAISFVQSLLPSIQHTDLNNMELGGNR